MNKVWIGIGGVFVALLVVFGIYRGTINGLVSADEGVVKAMANIQSTEKRRSDLIDNLVATVEAAGNLEKSTLTDVIKARAEATKTVINLNPTDLVNNPELLKKAQEAMSTMSGTLSRLLVNSEAYPTLKANENFQTLMKQLEGTENRINYAREGYNDAVNYNNRKVRDPWSGLFANAAGAKVRPAFEATAEERKAPKVKFNQGKS